MEHEEEQLIAPRPLPVLPRLDRLDRLLELLEEKHNSSGRHVISDSLYPKVEEVEDPRISLSSAIEEVHHKGTLMERLTMLEKRVLQLSSEIDEANTTRTSSSTYNPVSENFGPVDSISSTTMQEKDKIVIMEREKEQNPASVQEKASSDAVAVQKIGQQIDKKRRWKRKKSNKKWFGCFKMGC